MAQEISAPAVAAGDVRVTARTIGGSASASTTYYYVTALGAPGSTTDRTAIPSGATVLRVSSS